MTHLTHSLAPPVTIRALLPGLGLSFAITLAAELGEKLEARLFGHAWMEALVLAIVFGALYRFFVRPGDRFLPGIACSGKLLLEIAVVLLGASISAAAIAGAGPLLVLAIGALVLVSIAASYGIGRALRLDRRVAAVLVMTVLHGVLGFDARQYGVLAGLTVSAVPQVIAAPAPVSALSVQV